MNLPQAVGVSLGAAKPKQKRRSFRVFDLIRDIEVIALLCHQTSLEVDYRLLIGVGIESPLPGDQRVVDEFLGSNGRLGLAEVVRQFSRTGFEIICIQLFQRLAYPGVEPYPATGRYLLIKRLLYQGVGELI